ncbi:hypothetical protein MICRO80W_80058 [Micrococcus luteus]|nr:hypothetical protein MICRO80W_80058 [Micrococcus luteus]
MTGRLMTWRPFSLSVPCKRLVFAPI